MAGLYTRAVCQKLSLLWMLWFQLNLYAFQSVSNGFRKGLNLHKSGRISSAQTACNQKEIIAEASFSPSCFTEQLFPWQHGHSSGSDMVNLDEKKKKPRNSHKPYPSIHFSLVWAMQENMRLNFTAICLH